jgi:ABC-type multidrug transport system fused ATPase/permease subunit
MLHVTLLIDVPADGGDAICLSSGSKEVESIDTKTPFGKAFYDRKADFFVIPYTGLFWINLIVVAVSAAFWSIAAVVAAVVLRQFAIHLFHRHLFSRTWFQFGTMYGFIAIVFIAVLAIQSLIVFAWVILAKWAVIGRRKQGSYHWDKSSYCQRWQLHLTLSHVMFHGHGNGVLSYITGSAYIVWFYRALGLKAGRDVSIFAGGRVGLMTEPDLVEV